MELVDHGVVLAVGFIERETSIIVGGQTLVERSAVRSDSLAV